MNAELKMEVELVRTLFVFVQTLRRNKRRPEMASVAARREMALKRELEELERDLALTEQPHLPMEDGDGHQKAA